MAGQQQNDRFKDYVTVAERVGQFYQGHPQGRILTSVVEHNSETGFVLMRAEVYRSLDDASPSATGHAFEVRGDSYVNKTSYVENAETSAVGRALALLGYEIKRGIASREEMQKVERHEKQQTTATPIDLRQQLVASLKPVWLRLKQINHADLAEFETPFAYINHRFDVENGADSLGLGDLQTLADELKRMEERAA